MPTERFYHLPESKRLAIREAAVREFARTRLEQVSINKIIQSAGISRGSFYTYFEDKRDVMMYLLQDVRSQIQSACVRGLTENGGDYFQMAETVFEYILVFLKENDHFRLYHNMMLNTDAVERITAGKSLDADGRRHLNAMKSWLFSRLDLDRPCFRENIQERFDVMIEVTGPLMMRIACEYCLGSRDLADAKQEFHSRMEILKSVVYR